MGKISRLNRSALLVTCVLGTLWMGSCATPEPIEITATYPPLPSTVPELIAVLSDPEFPAPDQAIYALADMGPAAAPAVPALIKALSHDYSPVREAAAFALGEIGPEAAPAVPALVHALQSDDDSHMRGRAAIALGKIGQRAAVPALAEALAYKTRWGMGVSGDAAWAIAQLTGEPFPDSEPGAIGYSLNDKGEPLIVLAAREWWLTKGQYQDWGELP